MRSKKKEDPVNTLHKSHTNKKGSQNRQFSKKKNSPFLFQKKYATTDTKLSI